MVASLPICANHPPSVAVSLVKVVGDRKEWAKVELKQNNVTFELDDDGVASLVESREDYEDALRICEEGDRHYFTIDGLNNKIPVILANDRSLVSVGPVFIIGDDRRTKRAIFFTPDTWNKFIKLMKAFLSIMNSDVMESC